MKYSRTNWNIRSNMKINTIILFHFLRLNCILIFLVLFLIIKIHPIHHSSRRLILCTIPSYVLCRSNTVRYVFVINVHDQRRSYPSSTIRNKTKLSSPTLRKLCLPCITTRHHSNKIRRAKINQHHIATHENNDAEFSQQIELGSKIHDPILTTPILNDNDESKENNFNHFHEQGQKFEISFQNNETEENSMIKIEPQLTSSELPESDLLLSSLSTYERIRFHEDELVCFFFFKRKTNTSRISCKKRSSSFLLFL